MMKFGRIAAIWFAAVSSFAASGVAPTKPELAAMYDKASRELAASHYDKALQELDAIEARQPGLAEVQNLRGVVAMQQAEYDEAEAAFRKALEIDPKLLHASFNLADIPFLKKNWAQARGRFDALLEGVPGARREEIVPLIEYKILLTVLFENKEEETGAILSKLKGWNDSPAFAYAEAAIAFHRHKQDQGRDWMAAAEKDFAAHQNKLYLESFYEVGWLRRPAGESPPVADFSSPIERAARKGSEVETALRKTAPTDLASWDARYILAQTSFRKKDYAEARARLEALLGETPGGVENQRSLAGQRPALHARPAPDASVQLIRYQIFLTLLLEGNESAAQQRMEQFKFTDETPALYYAQAAWGFQHNNPKQANEWIASAGKLFSPALNSTFADPLAGLGWLGPQPAEPAPANAPPSPPPAPVVLSSPGNSSPVPVVAESQSSATPVATRTVPANAPSPAATASAERETSRETSHPASPASLGERKKKRRRQRKKSIGVKAPAATATATPFLPAPAATPRPTFLDRLARTLSRPFKRRNEKTERGESSQPGSQPVSNGATPVKRRPPEN